MRKKNRIVWLDIAKAIAMVLVIFGHTFDSGSLLSRILRGVIYSFHMPLFFIVSGYTFSPSKDGVAFIERVKKSLKQLILLSLVIFIIRQLIFVLFNYPIPDLNNFIINSINTFIYASGVDVSINGTVINALGMMWFLIVLFEARFILDYLFNILDERKIWITCILFSLLGVVISHYQWLPFSLDITFAILPFLLVGYSLRNVNLQEHTARNIIFSGAIWFAVLVAIKLLAMSPFEIATRNYPLYPLSFFAAIGGTICVIYFSMFLSKLSKINNFIGFVGKNSLILFTIHAFDYLFINLWSISSNSILNGVFRLAFDLIIFGIYFSIMQLNITLSEKRNK